MLETIYLDQPHAAEQFVRSLRQTGFAVLDHTTIDWSLVEQVQQSWLEFFISEDKSSYKFDDKDHVGYVPISQSETAKGYSLKDLKEFYHYFPWGPCPDHLKSMTHALYESLYVLAVKLLAWVEQYTPDEICAQLSMPMADMIKNSDHSLLRLIHYPPVPDTVSNGAVRAAAHEDINLITVLPAASAAGLQVLGADSQWYDAPTKPGQIIINTGDMLDECTNAYFVATKHRVINPSDEENTSRLSFPLFLHPRDDVILSDRHTAQSYRAERFKELGLNVES